MLYHTAHEGPTFHLHVSLKESLGHSEQRPAGVCLGDGRRREQQLCTRVDLRQLGEGRVGGGRGEGGEKGGTCTCTCKRDRKGRENTLTIIINKKAGNT